MAFNAVVHCLSPSLPEYGGGVLNSSGAASIGFGYQLPARAVSFVFFLLSASSSSSLFCLQSSFQASLRILGPSSIRCGVRTSTDKLTYKFKLPQLLLSSICFRTNLDYALRKCPGAVSVSAEITTNARRME